MTDTSKQGTGYVFFEQEIPGIGTVRFEDDGDPDIYVSAVLISEGGNSEGIGAGLSRFRDKNGDEALMQAFESMDSDTKTTKPTDFSIGPFVCDGCCLTWPSERNQTPDGPDDLCPQCAD